MKGKICMKDDQSMKIIVPEGKMCWQCPHWHDGPMGMDRICKRTGTHYDPSSNRYNDYCSTTRYKDCPDY